MYKFDLADEIRKADEEGKTLEITVGKVVSIRDAMIDAAERGVPLHFTIGDGKIEDVTITETDTCRKIEITRYK